jgi:D-apionolactonase
MEKSFSTVSQECSKQMSTMKTSIARQRVGTEEEAPEPVLLAAGAMTANFLPGGLRTIRYQGREVLRGIGYVVRDKDWGTDSPEIIDCTVHQDTDGFAVAFRGRCARAETHEVLAYEARITGNKNGQIVFDVIAEPRTPFLTARCGFTVLHPLDGVAGQPAIIEHVDGSREHASFPDLISPWQPFKEIRAIEHQVAPGVTARCRLTGDVFEMEDQRNWSDASYKTYVRPLALPWPYVMERGVRNQQSVELLITDNHAGGFPVGEEAKPNAPLQVEIGEPEGAFPQIGVAVHPGQIATMLAHPEMLKRLRPQLLLLHFDPTAGHGYEHLAGFGEIAQMADAPQCTLELVLPAQHNVNDELREIAAMAAEANLKLSAVLVSPAADRQSTLPGSAWPPCPPLTEIYRAAREAFPGLAIGGGVLSYFTELTRKRPPVDLLDFVSHCTCPIVHAADDLSVMQTLEAMPYIVRSARAIIGEDKAYRIGPSTIGMRQNPYGSRVMDNPQNCRITMTSHDPRQTSLFAAAWMIGYAAATAEGRLQALTIGALTGPLGLASAGTAGAVLYHPAFHTARGLADLGGHQRFRCSSSRPDSVLAVAGSNRDGKRVAWLANLTDRAQVVMLSGAAEIATTEVWDEENFAEPLVISLQATPTKNVSSVELRPYAVACLRQS